MYIRAVATILMQHLHIDLPCLLCRPDKNKNKWNSISTGATPRKCTLSCQINYSYCVNVVTSSYNWKYFILLVYTMSPKRCCSPSVIWPVLQLKSLVIHVYLSWLPKLGLTWSWWMLVASTEWHKLQRFLKAKWTKVQVWFFLFFFSTIAPNDEDDLSEYKSWYCFYINPRSHDCEGPKVYSDMLFRWVKNVLDYIWE